MTPTPLQHRAWECAFVMLDRHDLTPSQLTLVIMTVRRSPDRISAEHAGALIALCCHAAVRR